MTFESGQSGNKQGRPKNVPDRRTRFRALLEPHAEELIGVLVENAKKGDPAALRLCIERLIPKVKADPVNITLPDELTNEAVIKLGDQILRRMANQEITPSEGRDMFRIIESHVNTTVASDLLEKYGELSQKFKKYMEAPPFLRNGDAPCSDK